MHHILFFLSLFSALICVGAINHCYDQYLNWNSQYFDMDIPHKAYLEDNLMKPKWWRGNLNPVDAWKILTPADYLRSTISHGDLQRWRALFDMVEAQEEVRIVVLGGSVTKGTECGFNNVDLECAWPHRLELILRSFGIRNVKIRNLSVGGADTSLARLQVINKIWEKPLIDGAKTKLEPHVVVLAFSSNDYLLLHGHLKNDVAMYESMQEEVIREILSLKSKPMVVMVSEFSHFGFPPSGLFSEYSFRQQGYATNIASHYDLPFWSYKDAVWHKHVKYCEPRYDFWGNFTEDYDCSKSPFHSPRNIHMNSAAHQMMAYIGMYQVFDAYRTICSIDEANNTDSGLVNRMNISDTLGVLPPPMFPRPKSSRIPACSSYSYVFNAVAPGNSSLVPVDVNMKTTGRGWVYYADRKDKYGWVAQQENAYLEWPITLGRSCDTIDITYVSSNTPDMGLLQVDLQLPIAVIDRSSAATFGKYMNQTTTIALGPMIDSYAPKSHYTLTEVATVVSYTLSDRQHLFENPDVAVDCSENTPALLKLTLKRGNRFKITSIGVCNDPFKGDEHRKKKQERRRQQ